MLRNVGRLHEDYHDLIKSNAMKATQAGQVSTFWPTVIKYSLPLFARTINV